MSCSGPPLVAKMKEFGIETPKLTSHKASAKFLKDYGKPRPETVQTKKMTFCGASISFTGIYDEQSVLQQLRAIIPTDIPIKLAVSIDAAE